jgi:hypothetical protein
MMINLFGTLSTEGWLTVLLVMIPLFYWVVNVCLASRKDLATERKLLSKLQPLVKLSDEDTILEPSDIDKFHEVFKSASASSLVRRVTFAILGARVINAPDLEAIMGLLLSKEAGRFGWVRSAPNLLMLAGLLGTVFGLAGSVGGLSAQIGSSLQQGNSQELTTGLIQTLGLMQGAFGATLWGILLSLASSVLLGWASNERSKFASEVQDFALVELVPAVFPRSSEAQFDRQMRLIKNTGGIISQFDTTLKATVANFDQMLGTTGQKVTDSLSQLGDVTTTMRESLQEVLNGVEKLGNQLSEGAQSLAAAQDGSARMFSESAENLRQGLAGQTKGINKLEKSFEANSTRILEGIGEVAGRLDNTVGAFRDEGKSQLERSIAERDHLDGKFETLAMLLVKELKQINAVENLKLSLANQATEIDRLEQGFAGNSTKILEGITQVVFRLDSTVTTFRDEGKSQLERSMAERNHLDTRFETLANLLLKELDRRNQPSSAVREG